jgi:hypothetical protein
MGNIEREIRLLGATLRTKKTARVPTAPADIAATENLEMQPDPPWQGQTHGL